jgi:hypothetical protein
MKQLAPAATEVPQLLVCVKSALTVMPLIDIAPLPLLLSVTLCVAVENPARCPPKSKLLGLMLAVGPRPVPVRLVVCGLPGALVATVSVPVRVPSAVGLNWTLMVQEPPGATDVPQLLLCKNSPDATMLEMENAAVPVLDKVTAWAALVVLRSWAAKVRDDGLSTAVATTRVTVAVPVVVLSALLVAFTVTEVTVVMELGAR